MIDPEWCSRSGANLTDAKLQGADLTDADLTGANLEGTEAIGAAWKNTTMPDGTVRTDEHE